MPEAEYMTAGQFARKVGVTVRTIQYYDQQNLLVPSAKGSRNQRLYTSADEKALYKILTLKYLGFSLSEIKERFEECENPTIFKGLVGETMAEFQKEFQELLRRLTTLNALSMEMDQVHSGASQCIDWEHVIRIIETEQRDNQFFWHSDAAKIAMHKAHEESSAEERADAVAQWHELIADTIFLMSMHTAPSDEKTRDIAQRYKALGGGESLDQGFLLMENVVPHARGGADGSFDILRQSVSEYLESVEAAHAE